MIEASKRSIAWVKRHDSAVIVVLFVGALVAAFVSLIDLGVKPLDAVFYALQMILLNYDKPEGSTPGWIFHGIRLALPALASWALIKAYMTLAGRSIDQWMARRCTDHIVICGSGYQARIIAASHLAQGGANKKAIVLLTLEHGQVELDKLRRDGIKAVEGDATNAAILARFNIHRAAIIYIVTGADEVNLRVLEAVKSVREAAAAGHQATCLVHVFDDYLSRQTAAATQDWAEAGQLAVVPFNSWKESARRAVVRIGPDRFCSRPTAHGEQLHAVVIGYSWYGQQLVEQLARLGHYAGVEKLKVTLITPCAAASRASLLTRLPALDRPQLPGAWGAAEGLLPVIDLQFIEAPVDGFGTSALVQGMLSTICVAYVCTDDGESGMAATNSLLLQTPQSQFPIFVSTTSGLAPIRQFVEGGSARVRVFDALEEGLQLADNEAYLRQHTEREAALVDLYFAQKYDADRLPVSLARLDITDLASSLRGEHGDSSCHADWLDLERYWRKLPEWMRESSRDTVRHLPIKQRAIRDTLFVEELSAGDKEILSRMEHTRWIAERLLSGWRHAPKQAGNGDKQLHHDLVPFDSLSEHSKRKDAAIVDILRLLAHQRPVAEPVDRRITGHTDQ